MQFSFVEIFIGAMATVFTAFLGYFGIVKKTKPEELAIVVAAWKDMLEPLKQELAEAKVEIRMLREALEASEARHREREISHKKEVVRLTNRIKELESSINKT